MELNDFIPLNAEGFVDEVLLPFSPKYLNKISKNIEEGKYKTANLYYHSVKYGLSLAQAQICIKYFLQRIEEILGKSIEQIGEKDELKKLTELLDPETLANLRNEFIKFVKNCPVKDRSPDELKEEKITRLNITMRNMETKLSNVFSNSVIVRAFDFFYYIIDENKFDEINFICNMIDNLSLDNITDDTSTKFAKLVIFLNDFMFRKNNTTKFINRSFNFYKAKMLFETSKDCSYNGGDQLLSLYNVNKQAMEKYLKFLFDALQLILGHPIDLNCNKKINELLDQKILDIFKEEVIAFITNYGPRFYDYKRIEELKKQYLNRFNFNCSKFDYFNNDFFDIETPIYLISNERIKQVEQTAKTNILINYFNWLSNKNQSKIFPSGIENISPFLNKISNVNYDPAAINFILNFNSTKNLLSKIDQPEVTITVDEVYNFLIDFNKNFSNIIYPIPQQENSIVQQNSK